MAIERKTSTHFYLNQPATPSFECLERHVASSQYSHSSCSGPWFCCSSEAVSTHYTTTSYASSRRKPQITNVIGDKHNHSPSSYGAFFDDNACIGGGGGGSSSCNQKHKRHHHSRHHYSRNSHTCVCKLTKPRDHAQGYDCSHNKNHSRRRSRSHSRRRHHHHQSKHHNNNQDHYHSCYGLGNADDHKNANDSVRAREAFTRIMAVSCGREHCCENCRFCCSHHDVLYHEDDRPSASSKSGTGTAVTPSPTMAIVTTTRPLQRSIDSGFGSDGGRKIHRSGPTQSMAENLGIISQRPPSPCTCEQRRERTPPSNSKSSPKPRSTTVTATVLAVAAAAAAAAFTKNLRSSPSASPMSSRRAPTLSGGTAASYSSSSLSSSSSSLSLSDSEVETGTQTQARRGRSPRDNVENGRSATTDHKRLSTSQNHQRLPRPATVDSDTNDEGGGVSADHDVDKAQGYGETVAREPTPPSSQLPSMSGRNQSEHRKPTRRKSVTFAVPLDDGGEAGCCSTPERARLLERDHQERQNERGRDFEGERASGQGREKERTNERQRRWANCTRHKDRDREREKDHGH